MKTSTTAVTLALALSTSAQIVIPATNGSIPAGGSNGCAEGYSPGTDTVLFTVPYTYAQVLSIIGNYTNLTWSGSPDNSVTTNVTTALSNNTWGPGDARTYDIDGGHLIETITVYEKPANGPYIEIHTLAPLSIANVSVYSDYDAQNWTSICGGKATTANFTINFCATNVTAATAILHGAHLGDATTVGTFLGGMNYTSCAALNGTSTNGTSSGGSTANSTATGGAGSSSTGTATSGTGSSGTGTASGGAASSTSSTAASAGSRLNVPGVVALAAVALFSVFTTYL